MSGKVKLSRYADLADLYRRFTGHAAKPWKTVKKPIVPDAAAVIGYCDGLLYTTMRDGRVERYKHDFADSDRPLLCVGPDRQVFLIHGKYRFTEAGIVDASDTAHAHVR
jgi:hypothetical protein